MNPSKIVSNLIAAYEKSLGITASDSELSWAMRNLASSLSDDSTLDDLQKAIRDAEDAAVEVMRSNPVEAAEAIKLIEAANKVIAAEADELRTQKAENDRRAVAATRLESMSMSVVLRIRRAKFS